MLFEETTWPTLIFNGILVLIFILVFGLFEFLWFRNGEVIAIKESHKIETGQFIINEFYHDGHEYECKIKETP